MTRGNAAETRDGHLDPPFFRMHLRTHASANQHQVLLDLEAEEEEVKYMAPAFWHAAELNNFYEQRTVHANSFQIAPSQIGPLDSGDHHVAFTTPGGVWFRYSKRPTKGGKAEEPETIFQDVKRKLKITPERTISDEVEEIDRKMMRILERRDTERVERRIIAPEALRQRDPYFRIAYLARFFFDCQMFLGTEG